MFALETPRWYVNSRVTCCITILIPVSDKPCHVLCSATQLYVGNQRTRSGMTSDQKRLSNFFPAEVHGQKWNLGFDQAKDRGKYALTQQHIFNRLPLGGLASRCCCRRQLCFDVANRPMTSEPGLARQHNICERY